MGGGRKSNPPLSRQNSVEFLYQQKHSVLANISRIRRSIKEKTISFKPSEIQCRLEILNQYIEQAMTYQSEIDVLDPSNKERADLEDLCVTTKGLLIELLPSGSGQSQNDTTFGFQGHNSRLPNIKLPKFSGKYSEYKNFMGLFENLVDSDPCLTDIQKFNHLLSCLSNEALGTVKAFNVSEQNYSKAMASLRKVYDNPCLIFFDNISTLFDLPKITKPSAIELRTMIDTVSAIYNSLLSMGDDKNIANAIIIHLVMSKVDPITKSKWEEQLDYEQLPLWSECEASLNKRYQHISADDASCSKLRSSTNADKRSEVKSKKWAKSLSCRATTQQGPSKCIFCRSDQHFISACPNFSIIPFQQRFEFIKNVPACINCLRKGHTVSKCKASKCQVCGRSHNTLLHQYTSADTRNLNTSSNSDTVQPSTSQAFVNHSTSNEVDVILATAVVRVRSRSGEYILARALLDSCSQTNFITGELSQRLQLEKEKINLGISGVDEISSSSNCRVQATVKSRVNDYEFSSNFYVLRKISGYQPDGIIATTGWNIPGNLEFADPLFYKPQKIDMLIGAEIFFDLLCVGQIKRPQLPTFQKSLFGWIVSGKYSQKNIMNTSSCHLTTGLENESSLDILVRKFWEMEEAPEGAKILSVEQKQCEEKFVKSVKRLSSGRFEVALPFKEDPSKLGLSFETAKRRFISLERRLSKDLVAKEMYNEFMKEYIRLGHMSSVDNKIPNYPHYFMPHQCVLRPESTSTKLRVVFDASCRTSTQLSLNDLLMIGPTIQEELYSTLIRFRTHKYAITADIEKMYRQVLVDEADRNFQLILWREQSSDPLQVYRLNTVTYGTSSAPFLAIRCLTYLSDLYKETFPIGSEIIKKDFYVDDLLTGADSIEEIEIIRTQVSDILRTAGFNLTKWFSNYDDNSNMPIIGKTLQVNCSDSTKALGTFWLPKNDTFKYHLDESFHDLKATKRNILSVSARLFDPLGLLCPVVTKAKMLLQELWLQKLDWDESIPIRLNTSWEDFKHNLSRIDSIEIPRYVLTSMNSSCQIHGFADASMRAYGCCIYVRNEISGQLFSRLLTAKSKVAPIKTKSLPRLELCAAHLLAKLWSKLKTMLNCGVESITFWTDSEITLHWIRSHPSTLQTFVSNRVSEIQELSNGITWRHVPSKQNPADIVSRGCNVDELRDSIWFEGPQFLLEEQAKWPVNKHFTISEELDSLEKRKTCNVILAVEEKSDPFFGMIERYSSYNKLLRSFAYIFRFIDVCKGNRQNYGKPLTAKEMQWSFLKIVEIIQGREYYNYIEKLKKGVSLTPNVQRLNPFIHELKDQFRTFSLIRVGGRLVNAPLSYDAKFPLLLPNNSHFITLYLRQLHIENCHAGAKALVALLRQQIWLINAKEACTKIVRKCTHCFHYKPKLMGQIMGNLPADRVRALRPFKICGVDFCGPVNVTLKIRGRPPSKIYIAVFVCFTSKAVHLELVSDLTSNSFILCLKRFIGRRGYPDKIYSDNATNFVGAARELQELEDAFHKNTVKIASYAASKGVDFICIPPRAPHFGGLWEAAVKSAKGLLLRTVGNALLTTEELQTVLVEIEAVLNSRPIAPLSSDPNDGEALTPAHLLIGEGLRALPQESRPEDEHKLTFSKRWQLLCALKQRFWRSWAKDYVPSLQIRTKWFKEEPDLAVGQLVVVQEENLPPLQWMTGRVLAVAPGNDQKVRVAEIKTPKGVYKRPIHKLAVLPIY